ncbi:MULTISPECIES: CopG family ribbon-helix-helix protein [Pseudomonas]|uniref:CopG family ribbon-helix-helix protein n=1 Tax=Pseudomonas TaxID=286 RepID=UPI0006B44ED0|nr:ribbon-helix-helix protein, CopG family [Pseudomonas fuscovaginae]KPA94401.1 putative transcriptional regulator [Pseudomonas fuscovaginae]
MASPVLSFRVEDGLVEKLERLVQATDRDRQYHLKRALDRYLEPECWHMDAIAEGIADADAGNLTDLKVIKAKWVNRAKYCVGGHSGQ